MQSRLLLAGVLGLAAAVATPALVAQQPPMHPEHHWPKPKNLQVLPKDTTPEQLHKIMDGIAGSLGVHCSFCHVINEQTHHADFASDAKPDKQIARIMLRMTMTINGKYIPQVHDPDATPVDRHVTCGTCHRGHTMPTQFVAPEGPMGPHPGPPMGTPGK